MKSMRSFPLTCCLLLAAACLGNSEFNCRREDKPIRLVGELPNDSFNGSSYYAEYKPERARVTKSQSEQAWCPLGSLKQHRLNEWISVRFPSVSIINTMLTEPRLHKSVELGEFTKQLVLQYKRADSEDYRNYSLVTLQDGRWHSTSLIKGNSDLKDKRNYVSLRPPLVANQIRIFPVNPDPSEVNVCLKFELFGCPTYQGVTAYSAPVGHGEFADKFYDGRVGRDGRMTGGLGQLTDYITTETGDTDSIFVGWDARRLTAGRFVDLEFEFDQVRLFNSLTIDVSNDLHGRDALPFSLANVSFSIGGQLFNRWLSTRMRPTKDGRPVHQIFLLLQKHVGRFVKLRLHFDSGANWLLISELHFESSIVTVPPPPESVEPQPNPPPPQQPPPQPGNEGTVIAGRGDLRWRVTADPPAATGWGGEASREHVELRGAGVGVGGSGAANGQRDNELTYIVIIVSSLLGAMLLMLTVGLLCLRRRRLLRKKAGDSVGRCISMQTHLKGAEATPIHLDFASGRPSILGGGGGGGGVNGAFVGINCGAFNGGSGGGGSIGGGSKSLSVYNSLPESDDDSDDSMADSVRIVGCGQAGLAGAQEEPLIAGGAREYASATLSMLYSPKGHYSASAAAASPYSRTRITTNPLAELTPVARARLSQQPVGFSPHRGPQPGGYPSPLPMPPPGGLLVGLPMATPPPVPRFPSDLNIQGCSGNTVYACPAHLQSADSSTQDDLAGLEVPAASVSLKDRLGGGQFGEVRLAEWRPPGSPESAPPLLVAVKTLRRDAGPQARQDFRREIRLLTRLSDPNVVRVLGVVTRDPKAPQCVLVEYMRYGDLHQLLRHRVHPAAMEEPGLSYGCLIYLAGQVASGMKYLEAMQVTHRDLACRNCLLGEDFQVKICDFGMSRPIYSSDYCRVDGGRGSALPIRWMSWEAVLQGRFSSRSDVWSFAVTLWEMLSFCREQPFASLTDEQVVANCQHIWLCDGLAQALPCPAGCQRELYDLMCECWQRDEACRPAFREIHLFLQRKNMGFAPADDRLLRQLA